MEPSPPPSQPPASHKFNLSLDLRIIVIVLLVIIAGMLALWRPWSTASASDRTISVTGDTTVKAEPDEYQFTPTYQFKNTDKNTAVDAASAKQSELTAKLKALGVKDSQLKTSISGYEDYAYGIGTEASKRSGEYIYTLSLTVTQPDKDSAQKVQDYLATTSPQGSVTPYPTFSEKLRQELETKARDTATKNARAKADQSARNLGFKVASVKSVDDGSGFGFGGAIPYSGRDIAIAEDSKSSAPSAPVVQPGENELSYSVTVVYFIR